MSVFSNSLLVLNYNYSCHLSSSVELLREFYSQSFSDVVVYSDIPETGDDNVNFVRTERGQICQGVFPHLLRAEPQLATRYDGIFFLMDDVLLKPELLGHCDLNNVLQLPDYDGLKLPEIDKGTAPIMQGLATPRTIEEWKTPDYFRGPWKNQKTRGLTAIEKLSADPEFAREGFNTFSYNYPDFFFIPAKHVNEFCRLADYFYRYDVWLSIAFGSLLSHLEPDPENYNVDFYVELTWGKKKRAKEPAKLPKPTSAFMHPVKYSELEPSEIAQLL